MLPRFATGNMALPFLVIALLLKVVAGAVEGKHTLEDVYNLVSRIDENLRKEDRMREIAQVIRIDATMKSVEKRLEEIILRMDGDNLERGISSDLRSDLGTIGESIERMEDTSRTLKTMLAKMDRDLEKLERVEQTTGRLEKDLELRLTKLMNALSSLHEMNKRMNSILRSSEGNRADDSTSISSSSLTFLMESLEELERQMKEQFSVLETKLKKELDSLKIMTSNVQALCEPPEEVGDTVRGDDKDKGRYSDQIDILAKNISRSQREIKEEFQLSMQGLEQKLAEMSSASATCSRESRSDISYPTDPAPPDVKTKCVSDQFIRDARNCADLRKSGTTCDGVYFVFHPSGRAIKVYCDMTTDGGGWSVIMRRGDFGVEPVNFNLPWRVYKHGFGDMNQEFWLGNENVHLLTKGNETNELRIELESFSAGSRNFTFDSFSLGNENNEYRMYIRHHLRTSFLLYNNRPFITHDRITDQPGDCARKYKGGWWYRKLCTHSALTAERFVSEDKASSVGMQDPLLWTVGVLKSAEMKIRPKSFHL